MPELPEVETVRRQLAPEVVGTTITALEIRDPRWCDPLAPAEFADVVVGRRVTQLRRRGKYLDWVLEGDVHLLMHLRMTGTLLLDPVQAPVHTRVVLTLDGERLLLFVDPRRFGTGQLAIGTEALTAFFAGRLGVEPFDAAFTPALLRELARGRQGAVKSFLLDQHMIAGIGNIYADEALFRVGVHPLRAAGALKPAQYARLRDAIREVLTAGIDANGASIDDFRHLDGARGSFQDRFLVHRREGEPCTVCGTTIRKLVVGGRGTYVCVRCQPVPRGARASARGVRGTAAAPRATSAPATRPGAQTSRPPRAR
ncbi:MAG: bifunctional DNA-formamidopyrimidine glycosylase/DNA-(apurinic or apyrimidinic site) lyase [Solirubrobacteraceae bacterium]|jgi:formamidopyrimidine-DNA glycosylase